MNKRMRKKWSRIERYEEAIKALQDYKVDMSVSTEYRKG